jgi:hypothetical protein
MTLLFQRIAMILGALPNMSLILGRDPIEEFSFTLWSYGD